MRIGFVTTDVREHLRDYQTTTATFGTAPAALLQGFADLPGVEVHVISCARQPMRSQKKIADNIWFHSLHVPRIGWMRTGYQGCIRAVRNKLKLLQPDIVHGQGTELDCALDAVFSGFPNVITIHGNMRLIAKLTRARPFSFLWNSARLEAFAIPRSEGVICITEHTRQAVASLSRRCWLVPNPVDSSFFDLSPKINPGIGHPILCIGVICPLKNQNTLIRALDRLAKDNELQLLFLGKFDSNKAYNSDFEELIRTRPWCKHLGFADRNQVKSYLRQATLLILPSLEDNCPMVVLEAMAAGVPVVASRVGGLPELIEDGKTGFLCDPHAPTGLASAVEKLLSNPSLRDEISHLAKARARLRFHPSTVAQQHLDVYREVCGVETGKA